MDYCDIEWFALETNRGTQKSLLGPFQLPEYFNNSGDFLIPRELVLLHTQEKELENHQFNERRLLSLLQTHVDPHLGILNSSASLDVTSILASSLRSQNLKGRKLTSEMFPVLIRPFCPSGAPSTRLLLGACCFSRCGSMSMRSAPNNESWSLSLQGAALGRSW